MTRGLLILITLLVTAGPASGQAQLNDEQRRVVLEESLRAYDAGIASMRDRPEQARTLFETSIEKLTLLIDDGLVNGSVHYNLGNAYYQTGRLGSAILHYRIAQDLLGSDERLARNLATARAQCRTRIETSGSRALWRSLLFWHYDTARGARFTVAVLTYIGFWGVLVLLLVRPAWVQATLGTWRWTAFVLGVVWLAAGASVAVQHLGLGQWREGVITSDDVVIRKGNGDGFEPAFDQPVHQGVEFELLAERGMWLNIQLPDTNSGWVRRDQVDFITP